MTSVTNEYPFAADEIEEEEAAEGKNSRRRKALWHQRPPCGPVALPWQAEMARGRSGRSQVARSEALAQTC